MAETIRLNINTTGEAAVISTLEQLDKLAAQLRKPINIQINSNASKELVEFVNAQARMAEAEAKVAREQAKVTKEVELTKRSKNELLKIEKEIRLETAKQATASKQAEAAAKQEAKAQAEAAAQTKRQPPKRNGQTLNLTEH